MTTRIYVILDKSGSMEVCRKDTIGGFNSFVRKQKELKADNAFLSLYQFSNDYIVSYENKKIEEVEELTESTFVPDGMTALLDAVGKTIHSIRPGDDDNIIIVIITDGEENSSSEYSKVVINRMIIEKKEKGWEFVFLGANQDAIKEAQKIGIGADSSLTFSTNVCNQAFESLSGAIERSRSTPVKKVNFTPQERINSISK